MEENDVLYLTVTSQKCCGNYTRDCARLSCWEIYVDINLFVSERKVRLEGCLWNRFPKTCGSWELAWSVMKSHLLHSSCYILNKFNCWIMDVFISGMLSHQIVRPVWVRRLWQLRDCTPPQEQQVTITNAQKHEETLFEGTTFMTAQVPTLMAWLPAASQRIAGWQGMWQNL